VRSVDPAIVDAATRLGSWANDAAAFDQCLRNVDHKRVMALLVDQLDAIAAPIPSGFDVLI
jgi:hypothetical protein